MFQLQQGAGSLALAERTLAERGADRQVMGMKKKKSFLWSREAVGKETIFHSKAFSMEIRVAKVPKDALWSLKHSKASYIPA